MFRHFLERESDTLEGVVRSKRSKRLPTVLSRDEVRSILSNLEDIPQLIAKLLYGSGLRLREALNLRIKDPDWEFNQIRYLENP